MSDCTQITRLITRYRKGHICRRQFIKQATALGVPPIVAAMIVSSAQEAR